MFRRALTTGSIAAGLVAWIFVVLVVLNPTRLRIIDGDRRVSLLVGGIAVATAGFMLGAWVPVLHWRVRVASGVACGATVLAGLLGLALAGTGGALGDGWTPQANPVVAASGEVTVVRTVGERDIDSDNCVALEIRIGHGLLTKHRAWRRCEPRPFGWFVQLDSDGRTGEITYLTDRCAFHVDLDEIALVPDRQDFPCGLRVSS